MSTVTLKNINKRYKNAQNNAVSDFNLKIEDGEFMVLVGPSGCGKTTTLRMIAGLESIDSGDLFIEETRVNDFDPKDRDIAMVFQNYALYPHMTVEKNIMFGLSNRLKNYEKRKSEIKIFVEDIMKKLGLFHLKGRKPRELSGGEKQRVALARALVREPKVFLMDEPLSNLDAQFRVQTREEIVNIHRELNATFVYVTHDQVEAMTMGDRIVVMNNSEIQQIDTPNNIFNRPINLFVAKFIGTPQMNIIDSIALYKNNAWYLEFNEGINNYYLEIDGNKFTDLKDGMEIKVGIRSEDILITTEDDNVISANIAHKEMFGSDTYLHCEALKSKIVVKVKSKNVPLDDLINLRMNPEAIHLFCPSSEQSLLKLN